MIEVAYLNQIAIESFDGPNSSANDLSERTSCVIFHIFFSFPFIFRPFLELY